MIATLLALLIQAADARADNSAAAQEAAAAIAHSGAPDWAVRPRPEYPEQAFASGVTASVVVRCTVGAQGVPTNCGIVSETPAGMGFWQAAMNSLHGARFAPEMEGKQAQFTLSFNAPPPENP